MADTAFNVSRQQCFSGVFPAQDRVVSQTVGDVSVKLILPLSTDDRSFISLQVQSDGDWQAFIHTMFQPGQTELEQAKQALGLAQMTVAQIEPRLFRPEKNVSTPTRFLYHAC